MDYKVLLNELLSSLKISKKKFAERLGISQGNVSDWFNKPNARPSIDALKRISDTFNVNLNWLITGSGDMFNVPAREGQPLQPFNSIITLPVVADIAAGTGIEADDLPPSEFLAVPSTILTDPAPYYCFRVSGTSMEPELHTGDYAIVSSWRFDVDYSDRICAFRSVDGLLIKRFYVNHRGKNCLLIPINPSHPIMIYDENSPDIVMLGVLTAIIRKYNT